MTALPAWWRRNFGHRNDVVIRRGIEVGRTQGPRSSHGCRFPESARLSAQRTIRAALAGFGHRNDPPAMLPDPVRWTVTLPGARDDGWVNRWLDRLNELEGGATPAERWVIAGRSDDSRVLHLTREDGAYRWRDDSMRGF